MVPDDLRYIVGYHDILAIRKGELRGGELNYEDYMFLTHLRETQLC